MTPEKREELKRLAEKASQGEWRTGSGEHWGRDVRAEDGTSIAFCSGPSEPARRDARFIAAANPAAVLDLLREREEDQGVIAVWRGRTERAESAVAASEDSRTEEARRHAETKRLLEETLAENERLRAEIQRMKEDARNDAIERELAEDR